MHLLTRGPDSAILTSLGNKLSKFFYGKVSYKSYPETKYAT